ncbi:MAG: TonB-dependent receptor [Bacteroidota bacterium]
MRKTLLLCSLSAILLLGAAPRSIAQVQPPVEVNDDDETVTGLVKDSKDGGPLPGVNVLIKGTATGTITDFDGKFTLKVPEGSVLVFSYVGYASQEIKEFKGAIIVTLKESTKSLDEVLVVGYGTQRQKEMTGVVSSVHAEDLKDRPMPTFDAALQGRAPGLQVTSSSGAPGSAVRVRIRGQASVNGSSDPLYVVDGIIIDTRDISSTDGGTQGINQNPLATIAPQDIERIDVLKDASATGIYGARGANGVIVVTTKRGRSGKTQFNLNAYTGTSTAATKLKLLNGAQYWDLYKEAWRNDNDDRVKRGLRPLAFPKAINGGSIPIDSASIENNNPNTDWLDKTMRTGIMQNVDLSASGGNDKTTFYMALGYNKNEGILTGTNFERFSGRLNVDNRPADWLKIGGSMAITYTLIKNVRTTPNDGEGLGWTAAQTAALPIFPVYLQKRDTTGGGGDSSAFWGTQFYDTKNYNPVATTKDDFYSRNYRSLSTIYTDVTIAPWLSLHVEGSMDLNQLAEDYYYSGINRYYGVGALVRPLAAVKERHVLSYNMITNNYLTFNKTYGQHNVMAVAGMTAQYNDRRDNGNYPSAAAGFTDPYYTKGVGNMHIASYASTADKTLPVAYGWNTFDYYSFLSYFGRANYSYKGRFLGQFNLRTDGSSKFGPGNQFGFFPSGGAGWIISEENFIRNSAPWVSFLKFKVGYGLTGNSNIASFLWADTYGAGSNYAGGVAGQAPTALANPNLHWEKAVQYDAGFDYGFFDGRITGNVGYFLKNSSDLLVDRPVQISATGSLASVTVNAANVKVRNQGVEFAISTKNLNGAFKWTTDFNITFLQNKVTDVGGVPPDNFSSSPGDSRVVEGYPMSVSYVAEYAGIDSATGKMLIYDTSGTKVIATSSNTTGVNRKPFGSPFPKYYGGIDNRFEFMGVDVSAFFTYSQGNTIYDDGAKYSLMGMGQGRLYNQREEVLNDRWTPDHRVGAVYPRATLASPGYPTTALNTSLYVYDASFIRLKSVTIGYSLPASLLQKIKVNSFRIYVMATNLALWTKYPGWDPETVRNNDTHSNINNNISFNAPFTAIPQAKTMQLGVNIGF